MDNKNTTQSDKNTHITPKNNDLDIDFQGIKGVSKMKEDLPEISSKKEKTKPVIVRSFHMDLNEIRKKEEHSKKAAQLKKQMDEPQKKEIKPISIKDVFNTPATITKKRNKTEEQKKEKEIKKIGRAHV